MIVIDAETVDRFADWPGVVAALKAGHKRPKPQIGDVHFTDGGNGLLSRSAWISGLGSCVKAATIFPGNVTGPSGMPTVQGSLVLFDPGNGSTRAVIDGAAVTRWKTASDSALGSQFLSRAESRVLLMIGAGSMSEPLIRAHLSVRPGIERVALFNRTPGRAAAVAQRLADIGRPVELFGDLEAAVRAADIISVATMSTQPLVQGAWLKPGAHLDLVGAYTPQMREADNDAMRRSRIFVDFRDTTIGHIGELMIPIRDGVIAQSDVLGDLYDLVAGAPGRQSDQDITLYKNGGGGHLDLMTAVAILEAAGQRGA